ncbi:MAG: hypothetical protein Kow0020_11870 [Wenzhouxiangellaceae bacterium]
MKARIGRLFQRNLNSPLRRAWFALRALLFGVFRKRQRVLEVHVGSVHCKRVVCGDSYEAQRIVDALRRNDVADRFPPLVDHFDNQILFRFVPGRRFDPFRAQDRRALAELYSTLYRSAAATATPDQTWSELARDLGFLRDVGVIEAAQADRLMQRAQALKPAVLYCGLDYLDPVAKNLVVTDSGRLIAVDVEGLQYGGPLGAGLAKCELHWLKPEWREAFRTTVHEACGFDLNTQMPFVALAYKVGWIRRKLLQGKLDRRKLAVLAGLADD